jgi:hypothetical protein
MINTLSIPYPYPIDTVPIQEEEDADADADADADGRCRPQTSEADEDAKVETRPQSVHSAKHTATRPRKVRKGSGGRRQAQAPRLQSQAPQTVGSGLGRSRPSSDAHPKNGINFSDKFRSVNKLIERKIEAVGTGAAA